VLAGHWGRGVNSYACYFVEIRPPHHWFFRMSLGGAYGDPGKDAEEVRSYLSGFARWKESQLSRYAATRIVHNMGTTVAELTLPDGQTRQVQRYDLDASGWWDLLSQLD
jgi:hypothetical protein